MTFATSESKPAWESKVNWTQIISVIAMGLTMFGVDLDPDLQARLAVAISSLAGAATIIWRTWFTTKKLK
ncbi:hypothetical protein SAMN04515647_3077 [Cohaesibacter sp. ES.047]|uniref:hypothetical protein n=1 Tax=Cohaesibacter sp. ES.047 TaxID=1798205 RepID=UPI000BB81B25|nr:hypothetical protein [Cohaesibacter sp. ES.047]SNY92809.1 hypothetical protein SAMN04515647_3077 [Cohaesibacter sp. ES.047]